MPQCRLSDAWGRLDGRARRECSPIEEHGCWWGRIHGVSGAESPCFADLPQWGMLHGVAVRVTSPSTPLQRMTGRAFGSRSPHDR